jgi:hypothetical protein
MRIGIDARRAGSIALGWITSAPKWAISAASW